LIGKYLGINIKLNKTGGLTEAIELAGKAKLMGLDSMTCCMVSSSLGVAPAMFIALLSSYVDLDALALLAEGSAYPLNIHNGNIGPLNSKFWGGLQ
jgi:L-alanine-DL-glutamate epimerase-like enolase superfamily enzyme